MRVYKSIMEWISYKNKQFWRLHTDTRGKVVFWCDKASNVGIICNLETGKKVTIKVDKSLLKQYNYFGSTFDTVLLALCMAKYNGEKVPTDQVPVRHLRTGDKFDYKRCTYTVTYGKDKRRKTTEKPKDNDELVKVKSNQTSNRKGFDADIVTINNFYFSCGGKELWKRIMDLI